MQIVDAITLIEVTTVDQANRKITEGWTLLGISTRFCIVDRTPEPVYIFGKPKEETTASKTNTNGDGFFDYKWLGNT